MYTHTQPHIENQTKTILDLESEASGLRTGLASHWLSVLNPTGSLSDLEGFQLEVEEKLPCLTGPLQGSNVRTSRKQLSKTRVSGVKGTREESMKRLFWRRGPELGDAGL